MTSQVMGRALILLAGLGLAAGCSANRADGVEPALTTDRGEQQSCREPTARIDESGPYGPEIVVYMAGKPIYGLIRTDSGFPVRAGAAVKIVWRVPGDGEFLVTLRNPEGQPVALDGGPVRHSSSTYRRPGDEWGIIATVTEPGCWTFDLRRGDERARLDIEVLDSL